MINYPEWKMIKDEEPPSKTEIIVCFKSGVVAAAYYCPHLVKENCIVTGNFGWIESSDDYNSIDDVLKWTHLPKP